VGFLAQVWSDAQQTNPLRQTLTLNPQTPGQIVAQRGNRLGPPNPLDPRRTRIVLSHSQINWVKWMALLVQAAHADRHRDGPQRQPRRRIILTIFATGVAAAD
jgi:hypothetical protein